jgi:carbonic anhydrase
MSVDELAVRNVANTVAQLAEHDGPVGRGVAAGRVEIRGAIHDLTTGWLEPVTSEARAN